MKKLLLFVLAIGLMIACSSSDDSGGCGMYNGKSVTEGPEGGCYYINSNGNKTYVDRSYCDC